MAFNLMDMFAPGAINRLLQPAQSQAGIPNMLLSRPAPQSYPVAAAAPDLMQTAAVPAPVPANPAPVTPAAAPVVPDKPGGWDKFDKDMFRENLNQFFLGMTAGKTPSESLAMGALAASDKHNGMKNANQTVAWLQSRGVDKEQAWQIAQNPSVLSEYLKNMLTPKDSKLINAGGSLYNPETGQWITPPAGAARQTEYGLNPQYGVDENGNPVIIQLSKDGTSQRTNLPSGVTLSKEPIKLDAGTEFVLLDPITRQSVGRIPKDVQGAANETKTGQNIADATNALPGIETSANQAIATIDSLSTDPYLNRMVGPADSWLPNVSGDAHRVQGKMDQIGGQSFLQAFNSLKGAGAITEVEGQKATQAIARLNTAQNESDYREALAELKGIVSQGLDNARRRAGQGGSSAPAAAPGAVRRFNPQTGNIE